MSDDEKRFTDGYGPIYNELLDAIKLKGNQSAFISLYGTKLIIE